MYGYYREKFHVNHFWDPFQYFTLPLSPRLLPHVTHHHIPAESSEPDSIMRLFFTFLFFVAAFLRGRLLLYCVQMLRSRNMQRNNYHHSLFSFELWNFFNLLTPISDQDRISPHNINTISYRQVMRIKKTINLGIISWFNTKFSELIL